MDYEVRSEFDWLDVSAEVAAQRLLGCELLCEVDGREVRVRIVETEAYDQDDEASHAYRGRNARNDVMFWSAGHLYVYFTYGMHYCCNIVCGEEGYGSGALIRAVEPIDGAEVIEARRGKAGVSATNGPGKLCQALGIDLGLSGHDLALPPVRLMQRPALPDSCIVVSPRIGISRATTVLRRYHIEGNAYISRG